MLLSFCLIFTALGGVVDSSSVDVTGRKRVVTSISSVDTLPEDLFVDQQLLGSGGFGIVYRATNAETNETVAVKVIDKWGKRFKKGKGEEVIKREISIHESLDHPHIVKFSNVLESERYIYFFTELCEGGDLFSKLLNTGNSNGFSEDQARIYFTQIVKGIQHLHDKGIIHRDIKLDNILLTGDGVIKIADFGFATKVEPGVDITEQCGTPMYMAYEVWYEKPYSFKADVFSLGILLYALLSGRFPFVNSFEIKDKTVVYFAHMSDSVVDLISGMLEIRQEYRMNIAEVVDHPWMKSARANKMDSGDEAPDSLDTMFDETERSINEEHVTVRTEDIVVSNTPLEKNDSIDRLTEDAPTDVTVV